jgi:hypothetical protein
MKFFKHLVFVMVMIFNKPTYAFFNPADTMYLAQILMNAIQQLQQLQKILKQGQDTVDLMKDVNRGINDALASINSLAKYTDVGIYGNIKNLDDVILKLQNLYGVVANSPDRDIQSSTDQTIAEAITLNNAIYDYAKELDQIGENIKAYANDSSPGRATKITAQSMGVLVHVMNQQLRAQATGLKLQAQALAVQNTKAKKETTEYLSQTKIIADQFGKYEFNPKLPRF